MSALLWILLFFVLAVVIVYSLFKIRDLINYDEIWRTESHNQPNALMFFKLLKDGDHLKPFDGAYNMTYTDSCSDDSTGAVGEQSFDIYPQLWRRLLNCFSGKNGCDEVTCQAHIHINEKKTSGIIRVVNKEYPHLKGNISIKTGLQTSIPLKIVARDFDVEGWERKFQ